MAKKTNERVEEILKQEEINKEIKKEVNKYNALFKEIDPKTKKALQSIIHNAAFMAISLRNLEKSLIENGMITEYQNGENQWGTKKSPEFDGYNTMVKNYISAMKQINDFLPKEKQKSIDDGFNEFVMNKC